MRHSASMISVWLGPYRRFQRLTTIWDPSVFLVFCCYFMQAINSEIARGLRTGCALYHPTIHAMMASNVIRDECIPFGYSDDVRSTFMLLVWLTTAWWHHLMGTFSALLPVCERNPPVTNEFPSQRPVTRSFDVYFDLCLNTRLSKHSRRRRYETPSR